MQGVQIDTSYNDLRAPCPYCGHVNILKMKNHGDICCHLVDEDPLGQCLLFEI